MNQLYLLDAKDCLRLTEVLIAIQAVLTCLECLYNRQLYRPGHLLDWGHIKFQRRLYTSVRWREKVFDRIFNYPALLYLFGFRLLTALFILYSIYTGWPHATAVLLLCATGLLCSMRNSYSENGSDQLSNIVLVVLSINILTGNTGFPRALSIFFIAFQGSLAYFTAGFLKGTVGQWRNGRHFRGVMSTGFFGNRTLKYVLDGFPASYVLVSACLILWEITMGASPFLPPALCLVVLAGGVLFHLSVAAIMGFNTFVWAFLSTYPAIYFVSCKLH